MPLSFSLCTRGAGLTSQPGDPPSTVSERLPDVDSHTFAWYDYFIDIYGGIAPITVKEYAIYYGDAKHGSAEDGIPMLLKERDAKLSYDGTHYIHDTRFQRNRTVNTMDDKGEMVEYPIGGYYFVVITDASGQTFTSDIIHRD